MAEQGWYAISEPAGVTFPPCANCGSRALEIRVFDDLSLEASSTGLVAAAVCKTCGAGDPRPCPKCGRELEPVTVHDRFGVQSHYYTQRCVSCDEHYPVGEAR